MTKQQKPKKEGILSDHTKVGTTFVAPFSKLGFTEMTWSDRLPELIWMGLIIHHLGLKRGIEISSNLAKAAFDLCAREKKQHFALASTYIGMTPKEQADLLATQVKAGTLNELQISLQALNLLYPESPLQFIGLPNKPLEREVLIKEMNQVVSDNLDKRERPAMFLQANLLYIAGICGFLHISDKIKPPNLDSLKDYPDTEESKETASFVRATALAFTDETQISAWATYFWNQGLKIEPCKPFKSRE